MATGQIAPSSARGALVWCALALGALGCAEPELDAVGLDRSLEAQELSFGAADLSPVLSESDLGPCMGRGWGPIGDPGASVHIQAGATTMIGDGTALRPFATIDAALHAISNGHVDSHRIALWPGVYSATSIGLFGEGDSVEVVGCGSTQVILDGVAGEPVVHVRRGSLELSGVTLSGGTHGLVAEAGANVSLVDVAVEGSADAALVASGAGVFAALQDVSIDGVGGAGVVVVDAQVALSGVEISRATGFGLVVGGGVITGDQIWIDDTQAGLMSAVGRGMQLQGGADAVLSDLTIHRSRDTGLMVINAGDVDIDGIWIDDTQAGIYGTATGDNVVLAGSVDRVELSNGLYERAARAAVVVDELHAFLRDNEAPLNNGFEVRGFTMFRQNKGTVGGDDADEVLKLKPELPLNLTEADLSAY
jgi:hypothetical protein